MPDTLLRRYGLAPEEIERRSLELIEAAIPNCSGWTSEAREVVKRMVYAAGDLALCGLTHVHPEAVEATVEALRARAPIVCDVRMVAAGLRRSSNPVHVAIDAPPSSAGGITRTAAGIQQLARELDGGLAVIGNAPTALLALLDMVDAGECLPAAIIGTPVGFVAAAEAKRELIARTVPYVTVEGTRGGSAVAAAAMNALLIAAGRPPGIAEAATGSTPSLRAATATGQEQSDAGVHSAGRKARGRD
ncbi:MAG: precorrin-8X methylmutase [Chloroflexi bacterium]|nr:precorrin-8X methylmutase [Chloroflexota bacterium]